MDEHLQKLNLKLWKWNELHVESCGLLRCPT
jgi:hypothetical protein